MGEGDNDECKMKLVFLGTGSSASTPLLSCVLRGDGGCEICKRAVSMGPSSKDWRGNPSLLIQVGRKNVVIDCGKTFRESVLRQFSKHGVQFLDAVVLTHEHADAVLGIDDLRLVQRRVYTDDAEAIRKSAIDIFANQAALSHCRAAFSYLFPPPKQNHDENKVKRFVARIDWHKICAFVPFAAAGIELTPLPVLHGKDLICFAYCFGPKNRRVAYISDVSEIPPKSWDYLFSFPRHELMIVDCLRESHEVFSIPREKQVHFDLGQAIAAVKKLNPKRALFVGVGHRLGHEETCAKLRLHPDLQGIDCSLAFDGQVVEW